MRTPRRRQSGATAVTVALAIVIVGSVLAAFVPSFLRRLRLSKVSEAPDQLRALYLASAAYYADRHSPGEGIPTRRHCLPVAAGPAPAAPAVEPIKVDFGAEETPGRETWVALGFAPPEPLRFRYTFSPVKAGCNLEDLDGRSLLTLRAEGDLDGDGKLSRFERRCTTDPMGGLVPFGALFVQDRVE